MGVPFKDLTGQYIGPYLLIERLSLGPPHYKSNYKYICICGKEKISIIHNKLEKEKVNDEIK